MKVAAVLLAMVSSVFVSFPQEQPSPPRTGQVAISQEEDPCLMGGFKPGMTIPEKDLKNKLKFLRRSPDLFRPRKGTSYQPVEKPGTPKQFVIVLDGEIFAVVREFKGEEANKIVVALNEKYGAALTGNLVPKVKYDYVPLFGSVKVENSTLWRSEECHQDIEMISQQKMTTTAVGGGTFDRVAVVITKSGAPGEGGDLLK